jgi:membrane AbrB-like protein
MVAVLVAGALTGLLFDRAKVPGGLIIGAMIGSAAVSLYRQGPAQPLPRPLVATAFLLLGCAIGATVTRDVMAEFRQIAVGAVLSAIVFIVFGLLLAVGLREAGLAPDGVILATSPGALMAAAGTEIGVGAQVAVFHTVRVILVILSLPLLIRLGEF